MADINEVVGAYVAAWHEKDQSARRRLLETAWSEDGVYQDPNADLSGRDNLFQHIDGFHRRFPGCRFVLPGGIDHHHGRIHFTWRMIGPDGKTMLTGRDFGVLDKAGRIRRITGFFDTPEPAAG